MASVIRGFLEFQMFLIGDFWSRQFLNFGSRATQIEEADAEKSILKYFFSKEMSFFINNIIYYYITCIWNYKYSYKTVYTVK